MVRDSSTAFTLTLTQEERDQLLNWLEQRFKSTLVEEHRTEASDYKKYMYRQEEILEKLIDKLRQVG